VTSPRIEELPEELVEAFEKVIARSADERQKYLSGPNADVWREEPSGDRQTAEELLRLALSTGRLMLVSETTRDALLALIAKADARLAVTELDPVHWAELDKLSQALAQVEERDG
jgi:hypothetical protein